ERQALLERLYRAVKKHAAAVVWSKFPEAYLDLPSDIAATVICRLESFRGNGTFSTWVHEISKRKTNEALRKLIRSKKIFNRTKTLEEIELETPKRGQHPLHAVEPNPDLVIEVKDFCKQLPKSHAALYAYKRFGLHSKEIAAKLGITQEAVDSRWARLN